MAACAGRTETVSVLLANGAKVKAAFREGVMPLDGAARGGYVDTVRVLREYELVRGTGVGSAHGDGELEEEVAGERVAG